MARIALFLIVIAGATYLLADRVLARVLGMRPNPLTTISLSVIVAVLAWAIFIWFALDRSGSAALESLDVTSPERGTRHDPDRGTEQMAAYTCEKCGMSIGTMTCGQCGQELVHDTLTLDDGASVHISSCPSGHGKVKSPMCCGQDMACTV